VQFNENWNLIVNTRQRIEQAVLDAGRGASLTRYYDLDAEGAGSDAGVCGDPTNDEFVYQKNLWWLYWNTYGSTDTYGFSAAAPFSSNRMQRALCIYDQAGRRPSQYALDIYYQTGISEFDYALQQLSSFGEGSKPVIVQEANYDDGLWNAQLLQDASSRGITLRTIMQFGLSRCGGGGGDSPFWTPLFSNEQNCTPQCATVCSCDVSVPDGCGGYCPRSAMEPIALAAPVATSVARGQIAKIKVEAFPTNPSTALTYSTSPVTGATIQITPADQSGARTGSYIIINITTTTSTPVGTYFVTVNANSSSCPRRATTTAQLTVTP
jgi:hypothetical protein